MSRLSQLRHDDLPDWAEYCSHAVVLYSLVTFAIETDPRYENTTYFIISNYVVLGIFSLEYMWRIFAATNRSRYLFSFFGIIDFIAIIPSLLTLGLLDLRFSRALRLLRLVRLAKFLRFESAVGTLIQAFRSIKSELFLFTFLTFIILYLAAVGIWFFEKDAQPDHFGSVATSIWWAIVTLTTVGYGDAYPITLGGKIFTAVILMIGLGLVAVPSGLIASALQDTRKDRLSRSRPHQD